MPIIISPAFKVILIAILIVASAQNLYIHRGPIFGNILLFDAFLAVCSIVFFKELLYVKFDSWAKLFCLLIIYQFFHNALFSKDAIFVLKELIQGAELLVFYLILRSLPNNQENIGRMIKYIFYMFSFIIFVYLALYFLGFGDRLFEVNGPGYRGYLKATALINSIIPLIIFYFYLHYTEDHSKLKLYYFQLCLFLSFIVAYFASSRAFIALLSIILISYIFKVRYRLFSLVFILFAGAVLIINYSNVSIKYNETYSKPISIAIDHITNDVPFHHRGYTRLIGMYESSSNRQRLHHLKLVYQTARDNFFTGIGLKELKEISNIHGNFFIIFISYGFFGIFILLVMIYKLYIKSRRNINCSNTPFSMTGHLYLAFSLISLMVVGGGTFPMLPFIIASAFIYSQYNVIIIESKNL